MSAMRGTGQVTGPKSHSKNCAGPFNSISAGTNTLRPVLVVRSNTLPTVLVVEDEPLVCLDVSDWLSAKGYEIIAVANADPVTGGAAPPDQWVNAWRGSSR